MATHGVKSRPHHSHGRGKYYDHPDLSVFFYDNKLYVDSTVYDYYLENFNDLNVISICTEEFRNPEVVLNISYNSTMFFHNKKYTTNEIFCDLSKNREYVEIKQGYANCSIICLNKSIITSDEGIYKSLKKQNINSFLVTTEGILLNGYKNGFIGGTCGLIDNRLVFYGDVTTYKDYDIIKKVCDYENISIIYPKNQPFVDLGGIIVVN